MDYGRRERADRLAAAYVLGTLRGPARRRFEALLPAHPALREAVEGWRLRLEPMSLSVAPVAPPDRVWQQIERRLFGEPAPAPDEAPARWWQQLLPWRLLSGLASAAALGMAVLMLQPPSADPDGAPIVVVLGASPKSGGGSGGGVMHASFVASVSADGQALVLRPIDLVPLETGRALELWALPADGAPRSLGLVDAQGQTVLRRARLLDGTRAFAISVEPAGGSPTGQPTGPVVSVGQIGI